MRRPPKIKVQSPEEAERERKIEEIKEINLKVVRLRMTQYQSALRGFARQYRIEGVDGFGPKEFMQMARPQITRLMRENRQTRLKMILNCEMVREDLPSGQTDYSFPHFHTDTVENLRGTNESLTYHNFIGTIEERIQNFNKRGSKWRFQRVISLDVHLVDYNPLN